LTTSDEADQPQPAPALRVAGGDRLAKLLIGNDARRSVDRDCSRKSDWSASSRAILRRRATSVSMKGDPLLERHRRPNPADPRRGNAAEQTDNNRAV